jgi:hypothetical protein
VETVLRAAAPVINSAWIFPHRRISCSTFVLNVMRPTRTRHCCMLNIFFIAVSFFYKFWSYLWIY